MRIDLLVFDGMDLMDFAGPYETFLTANRLLERQGSPAAFEVTAFSAHGAPVHSYGGAGVIPAASAGAVAERGSDVVIVPGAIDIDTPLADEALLDAIRTARSHSEVVASVCTGAFLLAADGALDGHEWTTHWEDLATLAQRLPGGRRARVVDSGDVVTAGGISSGIDLGLHLVARFTDPGLARLTARQMDVNWDHYGDDTGGTDPVVVEREVGDDPATLYRKWTSATAVTEWLGPAAVIDPRVGGRFEFLFLGQEPDGFRGGEGCRILAMEPDRVLVFTWNSPPGMPTRGVHTWVVLTLAPTATGTLVRLAHWGHGQGPEWDANREYFSSAWTRVLAALAESAPGPTE